jgi:integrase
MRAAAIVRLRREDVDVGAGQARIQGKNRRIDTVPLSPALRSDLLAYLGRDRPHSSDAYDGVLPVAVWIGSDDERDPPLDATGERPCRTRRRACLTACHRASATTHFAASGVSAFGVQRFLRHGTPTMSQRYVDLGSIDFARLRASASPLQRLLRRGPGTPRQARARRS